MDGRGREVIKTVNRNCVPAIALDFKTQSVYWVDNCAHRLESVRIDGDLTSDVLQVELSPLFSQGISIFETYLYWTEDSATSRHISRLDRQTGGTVTQVSGGILQNINGIEVVHPSRQPDISKCTCVRDGCITNLNDQTETTKSSRTSVMLVLLALFQSLCRAQ